MEAARKLRKGARKGKATSTLEVKEKEKGRRFSGNDERGGSIFTGESARVGQDGTISAESAAADATPSKVIHFDFDSPVETDFVRCLHEAADKDAAMPPEDYDDLGEDVEDEDVIADATLEEIIIEKRKRCIPRAELYAEVDKFFLESKVDDIVIEIQSLCYGPDDSEGVKRIVWMLNWIKAEIKAGLNWDMINAILNRMMLVHQDVMKSCPEVNKALGEVRVHVPTHTALEEQFMKLSVMCDLLLGVQY